MLLTDGQADGAKAAGDDAGKVDADAVLRAVQAAVDGEEVSCDDDAALLDRVGQLDLLLTWLWRVHGIDYYGGKELLLEADFESRLDKQRTIRGPRPEEGEEQDEVEGERITVFCTSACCLRGYGKFWQWPIRRQPGSYPCNSSAGIVLTCTRWARKVCAQCHAHPMACAHLLVPLLYPAAKAELAELAERVDKVWAARLDQPDPLLQGCQRDEVRCAVLGCNVMLVCSAHLSKLCTGLHTLLQSCG